LTPEGDHILLLAGTPEARRLAGLLSRTFPDARVTASYAGAVRDLPDPGIPVRTGGFGGPDGLAAYLKEEEVTLVIDATHPFAARMSRNACGAAETLGVPLLRHERPPWTAGPGDIWQQVASIADAVTALPSGARAFLAVGRKEIGRFYERTDIYGLARMIEPPEPPLPQAWNLILDRPAVRCDDEIGLLKTHGVTHVVAKNSGGTGAYAKIEAARLLKLPVIMIGRPLLPEAQTVSSVEDALESIKPLLRRPPA